MIKCLQFCFRPQLQPISGACKTHLYCDTLTLNFLPTLTRFLLAIAIAFYALSVYNFFPISYIYYNLSFVYKTSSLDIIRHLLIQKFINFFWLILNRFLRLSVLIVCWSWVLWMFWPALKMFYKVSSSILILTGIQFQRDFYFHIYIYYILFTHTYIHSLTLTPTYTLLII